MKQVEFFFDCSSPWSYLAFDQMEQIATHDTVQIIWIPILVGGIFNTVNTSVYESRQNPVPAKAKYAAKDLQDWARFQNLRIGRPEVFPVNSVRVMRGALVAIEQKCLEKYAKAMFEAYWGELEDISKPEIITKIVARVGMEVDGFFTRIQEQDIKDLLRANTDNLISRGGFGSPTIIVDGDDFYFGNDRMPLVKRALGLGTS